MSLEYDYSVFLTSASGRQWTRLGARRRAGVCAPLFSLRSRNSIGVGEYPDLPLLAAWCRATGQSIIQLLPLNDVGFDFTPYSSQSSFALEPLHLSLDHVRGVDLSAFSNDMAALRQRFPAGSRVDYGIKAAKLGVLWRMFESSRASDDPAFRAFRERNAAWLRDYALYKTMKERSGQSSWESWTPAWRDRDPAALAEVERENAATVLFHGWLQWQCAEQLGEAHRLCNEQGVYLMGDLPFLVARDSADVWTFQNCFKLKLSSGAPPDLYFAGGQRWGMPPYDWRRIEAEEWRYLIQKLACAEQFFDMFRVDHVIGVFRLYTIHVDDPVENQGLNGVYDPPDKTQWEVHGRKILQVMLSSTSMLPCGEDLGVVPLCSDKVLAEWAIPGLDVQRWRKDWDGDGAFKAPDVYRLNSVAVVSTHDMSLVASWWNDEAGTVDEALFRKKCAGHQLDAGALIPRLFDRDSSRRGRLRWRPDVTQDNFLWTIGRPAEKVKDLLDDHRASFSERSQFWRFVGISGDPTAEATPGLILNALAKASESSAVFSIQLIHDYLSLGGHLPGDPVRWRVNMPGSISADNWSCVLPVMLEDMASLSVNGQLLDLHRRTGRAD
jgi:4-alpha-glucanotransferase